MWHASIAEFPPRPMVDPVVTALARGLARGALDGVGDATLGEWLQVGDAAVHLRRRLSAAEAELVGPVVDIRGDDAEVERRLAAVATILPPGWRE